MPSSTPMKRLFRALQRFSSGPALFVGLMLCLFPADTCAADEDPVFLFVALPGNDQRAQLEQRLVTALQLEMDGLKLESARVSDASFSALEKAEQLQVIGRLIEGRRVMAAAWIELVDSRIVLLHVVLPAGDEPVSQTLGAGLGPDTAQELAFSVQEMLGQGVVVDESNGASSSEGSSSDIHSEEPSTTLEPDHRRRLSLAAFAQGAGASSSDLMVLGGGLGVEVKALGHFFAMISLGGVSVPLPSPKDGSVSGGGLTLGIDVGFSWGTRRLCLGPSVGVLPGYYRLKVRVGEGDEETFSFFDTLVTAGLGLRFRFASRIHFVLTPALGVRVHSRRFVRLSDGSTIGTTSILSWSVRAGVRYAF